MPQILVRNLDVATLDRLKARAKAHGRSLQAEVKLILEQSAQQDAATFWTRATALQQSLAASGRAFHDSVDDLREERDA